MNSVILFGTTFALVFALGLQSLNVNGRHYVAASITSFLIGSANLVLFKTLPGPTSGVELLAYLMGGPVGIVAAMHSHPAMVRTFTAWRSRRQPVVRIAYDDEGFVGWVEGMQAHRFWLCLLVITCLWALAVALGALWLIRIAR